jgi:hypothetical protein
MGHSCSHRRNVTSDLVDRKLPLVLARSTRLQFTAVTCSEGFDVSRSDRCQNRPHDHAKADSAPDPHQRAQHRHTERIERYVDNAACQVDL